MSTLLELIGKVKTGVWQFWRAVFSANHDYPFYDYAVIQNTDEEHDLVGFYVIGSNQIGAHGTQKKLFTSKRMKLCTTDQATAVRFNSVNNVSIGFLNVGYDGQTPSYYMWCEVNVSVVFYTIPPLTVLLIYAEGVLPEECRQPE